MTVTEPRETIRLDKWLWHARFFKSRSLAAAAVSGGKVRVNGDVATKPSRAVGKADLLTFTQGDRARVARLIACGTRRGPAPEAQALYDDLSPPAPERQVVAATPGSGEGRPSSRDRRTRAAFAARAFRSDPSRDGLE